MQAAELAIGRWPDLLTNFGIGRQFLSGKHSPCPICGGHDRFRFDNKEGRGTFYCSHCGSGDGFKLLEKVNGWSFRRAAFEIERIVGSIVAKTVKSQPSTDDKLDHCRRIWKGSKLVTFGDPVSIYLQNRTGIEEVPAIIRYHPDLPYRHENGNITRHPAMIAKVSDAVGKGVAIHRTYLNDSGQKADVPTVRKVLGNLPPASAIRLFPTTSVIGIAEGLETALSASMSFRLPVWAAISATGLEKWMPPLGTEKVIIFGDNDLSATGQAAAWKLSKCLSAAGIESEVKIPDVPGTDWNDVFSPARSSD